MNMNRGLYLFDNEEMLEGVTKPHTDEERLVSAYVEAMRIVNQLDDAKACRLCEECGEIEHQGQKVYYLKSLPNHFFDVIQYTALEDSLLARVFPSHPLPITVSFAYEEALNHYRQVPSPNSTK